MGSLPVSDALSGSLMSCLPGLVPIVFSSLCVANASSRGSTLTADPSHPSRVPSHPLGPRGPLARGLGDLHFIRNLTFFFSLDHFPPFLNSSGPNDCFITSNA